MFTDTDEFASLGSNCPREPLSKAVTGKKEQPRRPAGSPCTPCSNGRPGPKVRRGSRVSGDRNGAEGHD